MDRVQENFLDTNTWALKRMIEIKENPSKNFKVGSNFPSLENIVLPLDDSEGYYQYCKNIRVDIEKTLGIYED